MLIVKRRDITYSCLASHHHRQAGLQPRQLIYKDIYISEVIWNMCSLNGRSALLIGGARYLVRLWSLVSNDFTKDKLIWLLIDPCDGDESALRASKQAATRTAKLRHRFVLGGWKCARPCNLTLARKRVLIAGRAMLGPECLGKPPAR